MSLMGLYDTAQTYRELMRDFVSFPEPEFREPEFPDLNGKVYIVTGGSSGIGFGTAELLLAKNATVYITGRTPERIEASLNLLREKFPQAKVEALQMDYKDLKTIKPAISKFLEAETRLDGIVHNAGMQYAGQNLTESGFLDMLVVNDFAPQLVQNLLDDILIKTARTAEPNSVRIVWVSSTAHNASPYPGGINWDKINEPPNKFGFGIYGQSKAINIYQAILWSKYHPHSGVVSVSCHPGVIKSDIRRGGQRDPLEYFRRPTSYGAYQEIFPLLHPEVTINSNGSYYIPIGVNGRIRPDVKEAAKGLEGERVWEWLQKQVKPYM